VERGSTVRRHVGSSVQSHSYCNALEKCVKLPVGEKRCNCGKRGVLSPPINRRVLVIDQTHLNEKSVPKGLLFLSHLTLAFTFVVAIVVVAAT
jgi:hypothetical protein